MELKLLGFKFRVEIVIISMMVGALIFSQLLCNCVTKEGLNNIGSTIDYVMNKGVHDNKYSKITRPYEMAMGPTVPLPEGQLFMFSNNNFHPDCCSYSNVSGTGGCACITKEQNDYVRNRGNNA